MIADLKPYGEYKESGLPWLGQVPGHWEVRRLKSAAANVIEQTNDMNEREVYVALEHVESWTGRVRPQSDSKLFSGHVKRFKFNDVLFGKLRPYLAKVTRVGLDGVCAGEFFVLRPTDRSLSSAYLELQLRAKHTIDVINGSTFGAKMPRADWQFCGNLPIPLPPPDEQAAIVRVLDWANGRLERAIRAKRKVIALLNEQKQAIIHRAVTRGIDPSVPLKDSGVPWLGEIPKHWEVRRLRHLIQGRLTYGANAAAEFTNQEWPRYIRITDFRTDGALKAETFRSLPPAIAAGYMVQPGDILLARSGATVGKAFLVKALTGPACHAGYLIRARPDRNLVLPDYLFGFTQSKAFAAWKDSTFNTATIQNIGADKYANLSLPLPPLSEQIALLDFLTNEQRPLVAAIARLEREITLLREYRTRLVADVVTGKLDVRAVAAALPDEALLDMESDSELETDEAEGTVHEEAP